MRARRLVVVQVVLLGVICGCSRPPGQRAVPHLGREAADGFRRTSRQAFAECPDIECLRRAASTCPAGHFAGNFSTIQGTSAAIDTFVVKDGSHCSAIGFYDYTADYWGGCALLKRTCSTVESMRSDSWDSQGCSQVVLQRVEPCKRPWRPPGPGSTFALDRCQSYLGPRWAMQGHGGRPAALLVRGDRAT